MSDDRAYCLVPDCDEQPHPGDELCHTHQDQDATERPPAIDAVDPIAQLSGTLSTRVKARVALQTRLQPRQIVYFVSRHVSRQKTQEEMGVYLVDDDECQDISIDVARAMGYVVGVHKGVILRRDWNHDAGTYLAHWLSELCGYGTPETALRYKWL